MWKSLWESSRAKTAPPTSQKLTINGKYRVDYPHVPLANGGTVIFTVAASNGCLIHTAPAQAFVGESASGYVALKHGKNQPLTVAIQNATITYCTCATDSQCDPLKRTRTGPNTIKVGSG